MTDPALLTALVAFWEALGAKGRSDGRRTTTWCWPSPATCRT
jgi:hypothetical protein